MRDYYSLAIEKQKDSIVLIGTFDGLHFGHQKLIELGNTLKKESGDSLFLITFLNHPKEVLEGSSVKPILFHEHKKKLLSDWGVDATLFLPFTKELSSLTYDLFLKKIMTKVPIKTLLLGHDARFGSKKGGTKEEITAFGEKNGFSCVYHEEIKRGDLSIRSSSVREAITKGSFSDLEVLLNRPYGIYGAVEPGQKLATALGFPTINIGVKDILTPPYGVYEVSLVCGKTSYKAVANLGVRPSAFCTHEPKIEVHVPKEHLKLQETHVLINFHRYIREEKAFETKEALKEQIKKDVRLILQK